MAEPTVMIVEDDVIVAEDLRRTLEASGYDVVGLAMTALEAVHMARRVQPNVILMDICLNGTRDGIHAARVIQRHLDTSIIFVTAYATDSLIDAAVHSGAFGYIVKPVQARQITSSIEVAFHRRQEVRGPTPGAHSGRSFSSRGRSGEWERETHSVTIQQLQSLAADENLWTVLTSGHIRNTTKPFRVTSRESEVIRWLVYYRRPAKVAEVLGISVNTARKHLKSVFRKLSVHSQDELFRLLLDASTGVSPVLPPSH